MPLNRVNTTRALGFAAARNAVALVATGRCRELGTQAIVVTGLPADQSTFTLYANGADQVFQFTDDLQDYDAGKIPVLIGASITTTRDNLYDAILAFVGDGYIGEEEDDYLLEKIGVDGLFFTTMQTSAPICGEPLWALSVGSELAATVIWHEPDEWERNHYATTTRGISLSGEHGIQFAGSGTRIPVSLLAAENEISRVRGMVLVLDAVDSWVSNDDVIFGTLRLVYDDSSEQEFDLDAITEFDGEIPTNYENRQTALVMAPAGRTITDAYVYLSNDATSQIRGIGVRLLAAGFPNE